MSALLIGESVLHYESIGKGKPVLFLHNYIGSWRYWIPSMEFLSGHFRCYALDLWGFGDSTKRESMYDLDSQAELVSRFVMALGISRIALVGHGFGAVVGHAFAASCPTKVDRFFSITSTDLPASLLEAETSTVTMGLDHNIWLDCQKADPAAITQSLEILTSGSANQEAGLVPYPHVVVTSEPVMEDSLPTGNVIPLGSGDLFPMLHHAEEFNRLLLEFLTGSPPTIEEDLSVKDFWKRRVR